MFDLLNQITVNCPYGVVYGRVCLIAVSIFLFAFAGICVKIFFMNLKDGTFRRKLGKMYRFAKKLKRTIKILMGV